MLFAIGRLQLQHRDGVLGDGETLQAVSCNAARTVLAAVSQLQLHFWANTRYQVYLTSVRLPGTSLEDNMGRSVIWHPYEPNELAVITTRRVLFFEADIVYDQASFLQHVNGDLTDRRVRYCDAASRVAFRRSISIDSGLFLSAVQGSGHAFLVCTTTGVVYAIGWREQRVVHTWTALTLRGEGVAMGADKRDVPLAHSLTSLRAVLTPSVPTLGGSFPADSTCLRDRCATDSAQSALSSSSFCGPVATSLLPLTTCVRSYDSRSTTRVVSVPRMCLLGKPPGIVPPGSVVRGDKRHGVGVHQRVTVAKSDAAPSHSVGGAQNSTRSAPLPCASHVTRATSAAASAPVVRPCGAHGDRAQRVTDEEECFQGTILHVDYASRLRLLAFVISSGYVVLVQTTAGGLEKECAASEYTPLNYSVNAVLSVAMTSLNATHYLLAMATYQGGLSCRRITQGVPSLAATSLWEHPRGLHALRTARCTISAMQWCPVREEVLCVGFYGAGVALVHYSGACLLNTAPAGLRRPSVGPSPTAPARLTPQDGRSGDVDEFGCLSFCWDRGGLRLYVVPPPSALGGFVCYDLARVLRAAVVGPTPGRHAPLVLLGAAAVHLVAASEADTQPGVSAVVTPPRDYLDAVYPLRHGAVTCDGRHIVCSGTMGCALYDRDTQVWTVLGHASRRDTSSFACIADPAWLGAGAGAVALPIYVPASGRSQFEVAVYGRQQRTQAPPLARIFLDARPTLLVSACAETVEASYSSGVLLTLDARQRLYIHRYSLLVPAADPQLRHLSVTLVALREVTLPADLAHPLQLLPLLRTRLRDHSNVENRSTVGVRSNSATRTEMRDVHAGMALYGLFLRRCDHAVVCVTLLAEPVGQVLTTASHTSQLSMHHVVPSSSAASAEQGGGNAPTVDELGCTVVTRSDKETFALWCDQTVPLPCGAVVVMQSVDGLLLTELPIPCAQSPLPTLRITNVATAELIPLALSDYDGYMLCATEAQETPLSRRDAGAPGSRFDLALRPVLYNPHVMTLLLKHLCHGDGSVSSAVALAAQPTACLWSHELFFWLDSMRHNGTFVSTMDYFLHALLHENPPGGLPGLPRADAVRATVALLRNYPEFYEIVVGCVRKMDLCSWHIILDFLGTPLDLYEACIAQNRLAEATHLVRVIMMGSYRPPDSRPETAEVTTGAQRASVRRAEGQFDADTAEGDSMCASNSLQQASACATRLFAYSIVNGDYSAAYDLVRFIALLRHELGMPAVADVTEADGAPLWRWLRRLNGGWPAAAAAPTSQDTTSPAAVVCAVGGGVRKSGGVAQADLLPASPALQTFPVSFDADPVAATTLSCDITAHKNATQSAAAVGDGKADPHTTAIDAFVDQLHDEARPDGGVVPGEREAEQRRRATVYMFRTYPELAAVVEQEATRLLASGYAVQLCRLFATFSLPVAHFLRAKRGIDLEQILYGGDVDSDVPNEAQGATGDDVVGEEAIGDRSAARRMAGGEAAGGRVHAAVQHPLLPSAERFASVFGSLHDELALPRAGRLQSGEGGARTTVPVSINVWEPPLLLRGGGGAGGEDDATLSTEERYCLSETRRGLWTQTQYVIYGTPGLLGGLLTIVTMMRGYVEYELAIWLLLMCKAKLLELICIDAVVDATMMPTAAAGESGDDERRCDATHSVSVSSARPQAAAVRLVALLETLTELPENANYAVFVTDVVRSLPPTMLCTSQATVPGSTHVSDGDERVQLETGALHAAVTLANGDAVMQKLQRQRNNDCSLPPTHPIMQHEDVTHHDTGEAMTL